MGWYNSCYSINTWEFCYGRCIGAGGLGSVDLIYGYQTFNDTIMYGTVFVIIIMVQVIQTVGNVLYKKLK
ncbi:hypothetical protein [Clostridioides sp. ES-S-0108-01]|uniref:hypothetical protein n=1 Tax=Clostridioides sp. ES-S-0108-01 TaxID=2770773 RepID=UPI0039BCE9A5